MRFTDEKKWSDKWFRALPPCHKIVWIYICDNCDIAGFYEVDIESISFHTKLNEEDSQGAIKGLMRGYLGAKDSDLIWLKNFLKHQNNNILNSANNCHKGIIKRIQLNLSLFPEIPKILGADEGLFSPTSNSKGKSNSKKRIQSNFTPPRLEDVASYCLERDNGVDSVKWHDFYLSKGWMIGKNKMKDWKSAVRTWEKTKLPEASYQDKIQNHSVH